MSDYAIYSIVRPPTSRVSALVGSGLLIVDVGHDRGRRSVTNDAENVVRELLLRARLDPRQRLFYYDSLGRVDEILHDGHRFVGFKAGLSAEEAAR